MRPARRRRRRSRAAPRGGSRASAGRSTARCPRRASCLVVVEQEERRSRTARPGPASRRRARASRADASRAAARSASAVRCLEPIDACRSVDRHSGCVRRTASRRLICPRTRLSQVGELESSKSAMKTLAPAVERVDDHLPIGRAGDLDAPVAQVRGQRARRASAATRTSAGLGEEVRHRSPASNAAWRCAARRQQLLTAGIEARGADRSAAAAPGGSRPHRRPRCAPRGCAAAARGGMRPAASAWLVLAFIAQKHKICSRLNFTLKLHNVNFTRRLLSA